MASMNSSEDVVIREMASTGTQIGRVACRFSHRDSLTLQYGIGEPQSHADSARCIDVAELGQVLAEIIVRPSEDGDGLHVREQTHTGQHSVGPHANQQVEGTPGIA